MTEAMGRSTRSPRVVAIIPGRFQSSRFPGKMLAAETGQPLIAHVVDRARLSRFVSEVVVATDDERIVRAAEAHGVRCILTRSDHANGTSRIAEAIGDVDGGIFVNVQGDEPELEPSLIDATVAALLTDPGAPVATLASEFEPHEDPTNPNIVKCVGATIGGRRRALWFSRSLVPFDRDAKGAAAEAHPLKHVGLYVYRREFLATFVGLAPTPCERTEQLEQLRVLEHGLPIALALGRSTSQGIDTPEQYAAFVERWRRSTGGSA